MKEMIVFLTSCLDIYYKDESGKRISKNFGNNNDILDNLKKYIKKYDNFLFVASNEYDIKENDEYANVTFDSFELTLPFKNYEILDSRTENKAKELVSNADFIFLCGGHLPTQNKFFNKINLRSLMKECKGIICGGSAGSMNCADIVYCPPEIEGESIDPDFNRTLVGLNLSNLSILPHYNDFKDFILDNKHYVRDIIIPDSYERTIYAINDGSYFLLNGENVTIYGECYLIKDGEIEMINSNNSKKEL